MATSQNGWPVFTAPASLTPLKWITGRIRPGDVHYLFDRLCWRFNAEVEQINPDASWGWAYRAIRGQTSGFSNHASATAIDLNAPKHPLGKRGTFTAKQVKTINNILDDLGGVIRWGGNYSGRPDEMHFEINASAARVAAVVKQLKAGTPSQKDWFDMADKKDVQDAIREMKFAIEGAGGKTKQWTLEQVLHNLEHDQDDLRKRLIAEAARNSRIEAKLDALLAADGKAVK